MWKIKEPYLRGFIIFFYLFIFAIIVPLFIFKGIGDGYHERYFFRGIITGVVVLFTLPLSFFLIIQHVFYYSKPKLQRHIIGILWIIPIQSISAWFNTMHVNEDIVNNFRDCYEAYAVYCFMKLLFNYLNEYYDDIEETIRQKPQISHKFPFCCLKDWKMGRQLMRNCKFGILQFCILRPFIVFLNSLFFISRDSKFFLMFVVNGISQSIAMYCLFLFYLATRNELAPLKPVGKFFCIKAVIYLSFIQLVIIKLIVGKGILYPYVIVPTSFFNDSRYPSGNIYLNDSRDPSENIHNFLLCFELLAASIAYYFYFSVGCYASEVSGRKTLKEAFCALGDFSDSENDEDERKNASENIKSKENVENCFTNEDYKKELTST